MSSEILLSEGMVSSGLCKVKRNWKRRENE